MKGFIEVSYEVRGKHGKLLININQILNVAPYSGPGSGECQIYFVTSETQDFIVTQETYEEVKWLIKNAQE